MNMDLRNKRRLAAEILGCGVNRVYIDPSAMDMVYEAVSRDDIRYLINEGVIKARQKKGVSRGRARKERWMNTIRPIRRRLRELRDSGEIDRSTYRRYYRLAKGGTFKNTAHLESHLAAEGKIRGGES